MNTPAAADGPGALATVTVAFHPEPALLRAQLAALPPECLKVVVDNGDANDGTDLSTLLACIPRCHLLSPGRNLGLAGGLNRGAEAAAQAGCRWLLLLDQDSLPTAGAVQELLWAWQRLQAEGHRPGAVGPRLRDPVSGVEHGFHQCRHGFWLRRHPAPGAAPLAVDSLNGSGTLMALSDYQALGGLDESLFIDHVDTDWSFRLRAAGLGLYGVPAALFEHRMGLATRRLWLLGWRAWPMRAPARQRTLFRNALRLMRRAHVPLSWKCSAVPRLLFTLAFHLLADPQRRAQWRAMRRGLGEGWRAGA